MPLYEYKCERCDQVFEKIQKFSDEPLSMHEGCGGTVERLFSSPALHFKGSGFYITDYARSKGGKSNGSDGKSAAKSESKSGESAKSEPSKASTSDSKK